MEVLGLFNLICSGTVFLQPSLLVNAAYSAKGIVTCQNLGIKILFSLGGNAFVGKYSVFNGKEGRSAANIIYNMFHPKGTDKVKPFGTAEIDGSLKGYAAISP